MSDVLLGDNTFLERAWNEDVTRLRLGVAPVDPLARRRQLATTECFSEDVPTPFRPRRGRTGIEHSLGLPSLRRTPSARHTLVFGSGPPSRDRAVVRLVDRTGAFVPRRLSLPTPTLADVEADEEARRTDPTLPPLPPRGCRPVLFPSVRYGTPAGATIVRGRALWSATGDPVRWARVTARPTGSSADPWRGATDHNGEFVVFVGSVPLAVWKVGTTLDLNVSVFTLASQPPDDLVDDLTEGLDPLKHLPVEEVPDLDPADPVLNGSQLPPGYVRKATLAITCQRGRVTTPTIPFVLA